jgi:hypothetical protein
VKDRLTQIFHRGINVYQRDSKLCDVKKFKSDISIALISSTTSFRGVSHDDYVDIKLAWFVLASVFAMLLIVELTFSWPENYDDGVTDDIFS